MGAFGGASALAVVPAITRVTAGAIKGAILGAIRGATGPGTVARRISRFKMERADPTEGTKAIEQGKKSATPRAPGNVPGFSIGDVRLYPSAVIANEQTCGRAGPITFS
jgi:hypothetical protein